MNDIEEYYIAKDRIKTMLDNMLADIESDAETYEDGKPSMEDVRANIEWLKELI